MSFPKYGTKHDANVPGFTNASKCKISQVVHRHLPCEKLFRKEVVSTETTIKKHGLAALA